MQLRHSASAPALASSAGLAELLPLASAQEAGSSSGSGMRQRLRLPDTSGTRRRVLAVSDLHIDRPGGGNLEWVKSISLTNFNNDLLIVAGDVADTAAGVAIAFKLLAARFWRVVWVPGNHCLWLRPDTRDRAAYPDSWAKLAGLRELAAAAGVRVDVGPVEVAPGVLVVPLLSWYSAAFDEGDPRPGRYLHDSFCNWSPISEPQVSSVMLRLNTMALSLAAEYSTSWRSQQQQLIEQQQPPEQPPQQQQAALDAGQQQQHLVLPRVSWAQGGVLAISSGSGRRLPGLQLNLTPHHRPKQQRQQQSPQAKGLEQPGGHPQARTPASAPAQAAAAPCPPAGAQPAAAVAAGGPVVITCSHFLPHVQLPHSRSMELAKAMGCTELQLQMAQVSSVLHVYGHSHRCADVWLEASAGAAAAAPGWRGCRYVQHALDALGPEAAGLYCVWDDGSLVEPGCVLRVSGESTRER